MYPSKKMIQIKLKFWISEKKVKDWIKNKKFFFILSMGRSGTKFLSYLLNLSINADVVHEPVRSDFRAYIEGFYSENKAYKYFQKFRKKEIYLRNRKKNVDVYGEINSVLRRHCNAIKKVIPEVKLIHLVRDGRDVVRSMMSRSAMTAENPITIKIKPTIADPYYDNWINMNRFEKLCWYWDVENRYLKENIEKTVYFEKLISNYSYFKENLLLPLELEIPENIWQKEINSPKNVSISYKIPHWTKWKQKELAIFNQICGDTMRNLGYDDI